MNETEGEVAGNEYIKEELIIKFYTTNEDGKDIRYAIGGVNNGIFNVVNEDTFIDKDGKLVGSITGNLIEFLKEKPTMLGIYKNYLEQNKFSTKAKNALSSVGQGLGTALTPIGKGIKTSINFVRGKRGGKTKSKRSPNANKTLKNRK